MPSGLTTTVSRVVYLLHERLGDQEELDYGRTDKLVSLRNVLETMVSRLSKGKVSNVWMNTFYTVFWASTIFTWALALRVRGSFLLKFQYHFVF